MGDSRAMTGMTGSRKVEWRKLGFLAASVALGFGAAASLHFKSPRSAEPRRRLSSASEAGSSSRNRYADLPCATREEYERLASDIKFQGKLDGQLCDESWKARLGQALKLLASMEVDLPAQWPSVSRQGLEDPIGYLRSRNERIWVDFNQKTSIAYNLNRSISLGSLFFTGSPLESLMILMHETRHSEPRAILHAVCRWGDLPKSKGACDEVFGNDETQGAYAFAVQWAVGLGAFGKKLDPSDREFLITSGLASLATRFNRIPGQFGMPIETLVGLADDGSLAYLHPFLNEWILIADPVPGEKVTRIEFNPRDNGLLLFTERSHLYSWNSGKAQADRYYRGLISDDFQVADFAKVLTQYGDYTYSYLLDQSNTLWRVEVDPKGGAPVLVKSFSQPKAVSIKARRLGFGHGGRGYVIDASGRLYDFDDTAFRSSTPDELRDPEGKGWVQVTGGIFFDELLAVNRAGNLYRLSAPQLPAPKDMSLWDAPSRGSGIRPQKVSFEGVQSIVKYQEGISAQGVLDSNGSLFLISSGNAKRAQALPGGRRLVDFAWIRKVRPSENLLPAKLPDQVRVFAENCRLKWAAPDPWLGLGVGLDSDNQVWFERTSGELCAPAPKTRTHLDSSQEIAFRGSDLTTRTRQLALPYLEVTSSRGSVRLEPYVSEF